MTTAIVEDYRKQAWDFLGQSKQFLAAGDLHQASEKAWGAAAHMAKAVAENKGWPYDSHPGFSEVINHVWAETGNDDVRRLRGVANDLHGNYYKRKMHLDASVIERDMEDVETLLNILVPLTE